MKHWIFVALAYFLGSIPFGLILTRIFCKIDVRTQGSGNIGATNVLRTGHKSLALATLLLDAGKGALAVILPLTLNNGDPFPEYILHIAAFFAIMGHIAPIWLKFSGGKGVATALGTLFALSPLSGLLTLGTWALIAKLTRTSSLSAIIAFTVLPLYTWFVEPKLCIVSLIIWIIILLTHRSNILRIIQGKESSF